MGHPYHVEISYAGCSSVIIAFLLPLVNVFLKWPLLNNWLVCLAIASIPTVVVLLSTWLAAASGSRSSPSARLLGCLADSLTIAVVFPVMILLNLTEWFSAYFEAREDRRKPR